MKSSSSINCVKRIGECTQWHVWGELMLELYTTQGTDCYHHVLNLNHSHLVKVLMRLMQVNRFHLRVYTLSPSCQIISINSNSIHEPCSQFDKRATHPTTHPLETLWYNPGWLLSIVYGMLNASTQLDLLDISLGGFHK